MKINAETVKQVLEEVLGSPSASTWLKTALVNSLQRDPVDAASDAELLSKILTAHCNRILRHGVR